MFQITPLEMDEMRKEYFPLHVGQRVTATIYGEPKVGTITRVGRSIVWVRFDGGKRDVWLHYVSVSPAETVAAN